VVECRSKPLIFIVLVLTLYALRSLIHTDVRRGAVGRSGRRGGREGKKDGNSYSGRMVGVVQPGRSLSRDRFG